MTLTFSEVTEADLPELTGVMTRAFDDDARRHFGLEKGGPPGYDNGAFFEEWLFGYQWTVGYKMMLDDRPIGAVIVWIFDTGRNFLGTIFVDPDYQNRGIGKQTWTFIESTFPDTRTWQLETPSLALKNHGFYETCGFRKIEAKPSEDGIPGETWVYLKEIHR